jgi:hypothetical protein
MTRGTPQIPGSSANLTLFLFYNPQRRLPDSAQRGPKATPRKNDGALNFGLLRAIYRHALSVIIQFFRSPGQDHCRSAKL